jgi:hypothetical protein
MVPVANPNHFFDGELLLAAGRAVGVRGKFLLLVVHSKTVRISHLVAVLVLADAADDEQPVLLPM